MTIIKINTPKGQYLIPFKIIVDSRAAFVSGNLHMDLRRKEILAAIKNPIICIDYLLHNTVPEDWSGVAIKLNDTILVSEKDFWMYEKDFEIVELEPMV